MTDWELPRQFPINQPPANICISYKNFTMWTFSDLMCILCKKNRSIFVFLTDKLVRVWRSLIVSLPFPPSLPPPIMNSPWQQQRVRMELGVISLIYVMSFTSKLLLLTGIQQGLHNIVKQLKVHVAVFDVCPGCLESPYFNGWKLIFGGRRPPLLS